LLKKQRPDLIILDILLPQENGIIFLQKMRKNSKTADIPVFAFSNYDDKETMDAALKLGVLDYLLKANHTPEQIVKKIKEYLKNETNT
jgi:response regulator of citrate/malate metabolism